MKNAKVIAFSGILASLSVVMIFLGTVVFPFTYVAPVVCGICQISAIRSINSKSALLIYAVVSIVTLLFMPDKECSLTYIFFFGYYPIIKPRLEAVKNNFVKLLLKLAIYNFGIVASQLICFYIFGIPLDSFLGKWTIIVLLLLANLLFAVYDKAIMIIDILYMKKFYNRVKHLFK